MKRLCIVVIVLLAGCVRESVLWGHSRAVEAEPAAKQKDAMKPRSSERKSVQGD